jgi:hypothetical protein
MSMTTARVGGAGQLKATWDTSGTQLDGTAPDSLAKGVGVGLIL